jgi:hypothetical protein
MKPNSPCRDQTAEGVERWLRENVTPGTQVAIRTIMEGRLRYDMGQVTQVTFGRFEVALLKPKKGPFKSTMHFFYSGRSARVRSGAVRLVVPTKTVIAACNTCQQQHEGFLPGEPNSFICSFR